MKMQTDPKMYMETQRPGIIMEILKKHKAREYCQVLRLIIKLQQLSLCGIGSGRDKQINGTK
jgi:hypothetical protein